MRGGQEGANLLVGQRVANEAVDTATAGALHSSRVSANALEEQTIHFTKLKAYQILVDAAKKLGKNVRPTDLA